MVREECRNCCADKSNNGQQADSEVAQMRQELTYVTHQVYRILLALHVPPCQCANCGLQHQAQNEIILRSAAPSSQTDADILVDERTETRNSDNSNNGDVLMPMDAQTGNFVNGNRTNIMLNGAMSLLNPQPRRGRPPGSLNKPKPHLTTINSELANPVFSRPTAAVNHRFGARPGRRSRYTTNKKVVADYAHIHGASAAAKRFNLPPSVAAYYHRKLYGRCLPKGRRPFSATVHYEPVGSCDAGDVEQNQDGSWQQTSPTGLDIARQMHRSSPQQYQSPNHSTLHLMDHGTPGLAESRQQGSRGRPKLIGDELDAQLIDHLVDLMLEGHSLSADGVLTLAHDYVAKNAPGLLLDQGGTVSLKLTWATKVLQRATDTLKYRRYKAQEQAESIGQQRFDESVSSQVTLPSASQHPTTKQSKIDALADLLSVKQEEKERASNASNSSEAHSPTAIDLEMNALA